VQDSVAAKLCPECGRFLIRHKVGHGVDFCIDRCTACGGIWLDANEWQQLRRRGLHDDLHFVFSAAWQAGLHREDDLTRHEHMLAQKLGAADAAEIRRIKQWIDAHPHRAALCAYLLHASDPPSAPPGPTL
jgi:Zn-finger nucleic acid-binding protein